MAPGRNRGPLEDSRLDASGVKEKNSSFSVPPVAIKGRRNASSNALNGSHLRAVTTLAVSPEDSAGQQAGSEATTGV